ncbi:MAG: NAD(P)H-dependent oxidoreductase [Acidimicrobiales bacterium]|nr:NAD(P)H-dependent oxidoreductase [Acidimicrobiales bacterium]MCB9395632.1 NAD(P)H-dependent oxidoreductase [Acidimicrobiaceae bacterium]
MRVLALNCTLRPSPSPSSTDRMLALLEERFVRAGATWHQERVVDHRISFGVSTDEGGHDEWPRVRALIVDADIVVIGTPIWLGHPAGVCQMVLERLDAELSEIDEAGRPSMSDKVAMVAVVGNEDGAHHVSAAVLQALNDVGFAVAPQSAVYWVGRAMEKVDFKDLDSIPEPVSSAVSTAARNAWHLARLLRADPLPAA